MVKNHTRYEKLEIRFQFSTPKLVYRPVQPNVTNYKFNFAGLYYFILKWS